MPKNSITLQKLIEQIKFHGENIQISFAESDEPYRVIEFLPTNKCLMIIISDKKVKKEVDVYFFARDNKEIIPSSDGVYALMSNNGFIWKIKFFLAVSNLSETTV